MDRPPSNPRSFTFRKKTFQTLSAYQKNEREGLTLHHSERLFALESTRDDEIKALELEQKQTLMEVEQRHADELARIHKQQKKERKKLQKEHSAALDEKKSCWNAKVDEEKKGQAIELAELEKRHMREELWEGEPERFPANYDIDDFLKYTVRNILHLKNIDTKPYADILRSHLICTVGWLRKLDLERLSKMGLPLMLEEQLERMILHYPQYIETKKEQRRQAMDLIITSNRRSTGNTNEKTDTPKVNYAHKDSDATQIQYKRVKMIFVGEGGVGKTSLVRYLHSGKTCKKNNQFSKATDGIDIIEHGSKKQAFSFDFFDFAGQELYYTTHQFFLLSRAIYAVVYDISSDNYTKIEYWLKSIRLRSREAIILVIGTHADEPKCTEEYLENVARQLKKKYKKYRVNNFFQVTLIKKNAKGVKLLEKYINELVQTHQLFQVFLEPRLHRIATSIDSSRLKKHETNNRAIISVDDFADMHQLEDSEVSSTLQVLSELGVVMHFPTVPNLNDLVVLDAKYLADLMALIVTYKHNYIKNGIIYPEDLRRVFTTDAGNHKSLVNLLERFEVVFQLKLKTTSSIDQDICPVLVPCTLQDKQPVSYRIALNKMLETLPANMTQYRRVYNFEFLPIGFVPRLIVRIVHLKGVKWSDTWRRGIKLEMGDEKLIVDYDNVECKLQVICQTTTENLLTTKSLFTNVIACIDALVAMLYRNRLENDAIKINLPCIHCIETRDGFVSMRPTMFPYQDVVNAFISGEHSMKCINYSVPLERLAPDICVSYLPICKDVVVGKQLGAGGFAVVYEGTSDGKVVAIKRLKEWDKPGENLDNLRAFREFQHEVYLLSKLDSDYLVRFYGITLSPVQIVLELIEKGSLDIILVDKTLNDAVFNWMVRLRIARDVAKGMAYLHAQQPAILHRDLRSPNVFITSLDTSQEVIAKVGDFGMAQYAAPYLSELLPTWQWLAPEVINPKSKVYSASSDVYSLAMVCWELAARKTPFAEYLQFVIKTEETWTEEQFNDEVVLEQSISSRLKGEGKTEEEIKDYIRIKLSDANNTVKALLVEELAQHGFSVVGSRVYREEFKKHEIIDAIITKDLRPTFPKSTPENFRKLIYTSWVASPVRRPKCSDLVIDLENQIASLKNSVKTSAARNAK